MINVCFITAFVSQNYRDLFNLAYHKQLRPNLWERDNYLWTSGELWNLASESNCNLESHYVQMNIIIILIIIMYLYAINSYY